ncbi:MAG: cupredoxin domain-containing protein [Chloroflexota bacterium]|nr:cupredoxin domain-containing protein [Chloroflexota bacterium]
MSQPGRLPGGRLRPGQAGGLERRAPGIGRVAGTCSIDSANGRRQATTGRYARAREHCDWGELRSRTLRTQRTHRYPGTQRVDRQQFRSCHRDPNGIAVDDDFFSPKEITVAVGTTVVWRYDGEGEEQHNVVALDGSFSSPTLTVGQGFSYTFTKPGEYKYVCSFHIPQGMTGQVTVQ